MSNNRELITAALLWHTAHARRLEVGKEKRRLDAQIRACGDDGWCLQRCVEQNETGRQLTELKRKELAALRLLAKACAKQRARMDVAEVIELKDFVAPLPTLTSDGHTPSS